VTPIVHSAVGLVGWHKAVSQKNIKTLFLFILISNIPDIDFFLFIFFSKQELQLHQSYTHNIFFISFFTLFLFLLFRTNKERIGLFLVSFSHLILDLVIIDPVSPVGFRLFFPLSDKLVNFGFFPNFLRGSFGELFSWHNMVTISLETTFFVIPILVISGREIKYRFSQKEFWKI
jgi:membrane-bound metal-dependent hydrolase YbcI (DUF457 family)